jgi:hypothetical protein
LSRSGSIMPTSYMLRFQLWRKVGSIIQLLYSFADLFSVRGADRLVWFI